MSYSNTLHYWRNSLADASRPSIRLMEGKVIYYICNHDSKDVDFRKGRVIEPLATQIVELECKKLNERKGIYDFKNPDWTPLEEVSILISPFFINSTILHGQSIQDESLMMPFLIPARLHRSGRLSLTDETQPYVARDYLEPLPPQTIDYTFSSVEQVDQALADLFIESRWESYFNHLNRLFENMTGEPMDDYAPVDFRRIDKVGIIINESVQSASEGIVALYDYFIQVHQDKIPLLESLISPESKPVKSLIPLNEFPQSSLGHLGQMGYEFPLSVSQRQSVYEINRMNDGDILAVNGPPGTGKTTLLQSIVANEVVKSALIGRAPTLILACSTNNQAVTNIVDSFQKIKTRNDKLFERWIPNVNSFALYLPSMGKTIPENIPYQKLNGGVTSKIEHSSFLYEAKGVFINNFHQSYASARDIDSAGDIAEFLRNILIAKDAELKDGVRIWEDFLKIAGLLKDLGYTHYITVHSSTLNKVIAAAKEHLLNYERKKNDYFLREPWWIKLFAFLPFIARIREQQLRSLFRDFDFTIDAVNLRSADAVDGYFESRFTIIKRIQQLVNQWEQWKGKNNIKGNPPTSTDYYREIGNGSTPYFFNELEISLKNELFFIATHYWEARWLIELEKALDEDSVWKTSGDFALQRWRRFSMLFPCFVSTFYMAPKFFHKLNVAGKDSSGKRKYDQTPLISSIDYLIVDEAGQVTPEVGAATFGLAKKAIVVGDTLQIDPVWSVTKRVDKANVYKHKLARNDQEYFSYDKLGFLCSTGSIVKLAQKSSPYHVKKDLSRGLWLTEHRRCYDEIIEYCNKLAYNNLLEPKKGKAPSSLILPPVNFVNHSFPTDTSKVSKSNKGEANFIAEWVLKHQSAIVDYYQEIENTAASKEGRKIKQLVLGDVLAIVTPFALQETVLKSILRRAGVPMKNLTIGTVHALQGAERSIILFSTVYGANMAGNAFFYDRGPNMLNVAVSRAKDSFILFGHAALYQDRSSTKPSTLLYKHISHFESKILL